MARKTVEESWTPEKEQKEPKAGTKAHAVLLHGRKALADLQAAITLFTETTGRDSVSAGELARTMEKTKRASWSADSAKSEVWRVSRERFETTNGLFCQLGHELNSLAQSWCRLRNAAENRLKPAQEAAKEAAQRALDETLV